MYELDLLTQLLSLQSTDSEHALLCVQMAQLLWAMGDTAEPLPLHDNNRYAYDKYTPTRLSHH